MKRLQVILLGLLLLGSFEGHAKSSESALEMEEGFRNSSEDIPIQPLKDDAERIPHLSEIASLNGTWVRIDGNNKKANGMVIQIKDSQGIIVNAANTRLKAGDIKWKNIVSTGTNTFKHQELGSNYKYYDGTMELSAKDKLTVMVGASGRGNAQIWQRNAENLKNSSLKDSELSENKNSIVNGNQKPIAAIGPNGEELYVYPNNTYKANEKVPEELTGRLFTYLQDGHIITDIEFVPQGSGWAIATNRQVMARNIGGQFLAKASETYGANGYIADLEFKPVNWNRERAFVFMDQNGTITDNTSKKKINFDRNEVIRVEPSNRKKREATKIKYTVSCDWLVVYEAHDMGVDGNALELYGRANLSVWFKDPGDTPITVRLEKNVDFSGANGTFKGEIFSIEENSLVKLRTGEGTALPEGKVEITIDLNDFGGISLEEFENNTWLNLVFFFVEKDLGNTFMDLFPRTERKVYLSEADIEPVQSLSTLFENEAGGGQSTIRNNMVRMRYKSDEIGVSFSLIREIIE
ncbi:MAG: hypothetical protein ACX93O_13585 [Flagellimonas sp.]